MGGSYLQPTAAAARSGVVDSAPVHPADDVAQNYKDGGDYDHDECNSSAVPPHGRDGTSEGSVGLDRLLIDAGGHFVSRVGYSTRSRYGTRFVGGQQFALSETTTTTAVSCFRISAPF